MFKSVFVVSLFSIFVGMIYFQGGKTISHISYLNKLSLANLNTATVDCYQSIFEVDHVGTEIRCSRGGFISPIINVGVMSADRNDRVPRLKDKI